MPKAFTEPPEARFWDMVDKTGDCWLWRGGAFNATGQPLFTRQTTPTRVRVVAQRFLHEMENGPLSAGAVIFRTCATKACVRHFRVGTQADFDRWSDDRLAANFWAKVDKSDADGCWLWTAARYGARYGQAHYKGQGQSASRVAWQLTHGPIPDGLYVCHRCDNPPCCRPDHLFLGSAADNAADMVSKGRSSRSSGIARRRFTADQIREIRTRYAAGQASLYVLAREFGCTPMAIQHIVKLKTYADVD